MESSTSLYTKLAPRDDGNDQDIRLLMSSDGGRRGAFVEDWLKRHVVASDAAKKPMSEDLVFKTQNLRLRGRANRSSPVVAVRRPAGLTARQQRRTGIFKVAPKQQRYAMYEPLHELWKDYMRDLVQLDRLKASGFSQIGARLMKADYHGAFVSVRRSKCPSLVGAEGIVLRETRNTFQLITRDDVLKTIPKQNTVFDLKLGVYTVTIYGNNFRYRASDRSKRVFRTRHSIDF